MRRRVISVTRRHIEFLFGTCKDSAPFFTRSEDMPNSFAQVQARAVERIIKRNREETTVASELREFAARMKALVDSVEPNESAPDEYWRGARDGAESIIHRAIASALIEEEGAWQLPPSDESKVGLD